MEGLVQHVRKVRGILDQPVVLGAGAGDPDGVGLLEGVRSDHEGRHLPGEHDDGDRIHQRVGDAGHRIGGARSGCHEHHTGPARGAGIALGRMDRPLFMAHQHMADPVLLENLVINRQHRAAWIPEYDVHTLVLEGLNHHFRSGHLTCHMLAPFMTSFNLRAHKKTPEVSGAHGYRYGVRYRPMRHCPTSTIMRAIGRVLCVRARQVRGGAKGRQQAFADKMSP